MMSVVGPVMRNLVSEKEFEADSSVLAMVCKFEGRNSYLTKRRRCWILRLSSSGRSLRIKLQVLVTY